MRKWQNTAMYHNRDGAIKKNMERHMTIHTAYPLATLHTFGLDVQAAHFIEVHSVEELQQVLRLPGNLLFLGGGSNILFTGDYDGTVIKLALRGVRIEEENDDKVLLRIAAGETWHDIVLYCVERDWWGIENLSLIPGTAGAAPIQNIGAYGTELKDVLVSVEGVDRQTGALIQKSNAECHFGYRTSVFKEELRNRVVITSILLQLAKKPRPNLSYPALAQAVPNHQSIAIRDICNAVCAIRRSKLPDPAVYGNAGSFFKNPEILPEQADALRERYPAIPSFPIPTGRIKIPAGWLIEQCGWKGKRIGNAGTYPQQALVLVNYGNATGNELLTVAQTIQRDVLERFGIELQPEVNIL